MLIWPGSVCSFSGPPFTSEGGTKSCESSGSAISLHCTAPAGAWFAGQAVCDAIGQGTVRSHLVVIKSPALELLSDVAQVEKSFDV